MRALLIACVLLPTALSANQDSGFITTYGGGGPDRGIHIIQATDGNLVMVGNTTNEAGNLDIYLLKCDTSGDTLWTGSYGGPDHDNGWCVRETADGGFIITGFSESPQTGKSDILLLKTDGQGNQLWSKAYGGEGDDIAWALALNEDGGFTVAAQTDGRGMGELDAYVLRTDAEGDTLWTRTFGGPQTDRVFSIAQAEDGSIFAAGITYSFGAGDRDAYLLKIDRAGSLLWQQTYGGPGYDNAHGVILSREGSVILTGYGHHWGDAGTMGIFLKEITPGGDEVWTGVYGGAKHDRAMTVSQTRDGGYVVVGFTQSFGQGEWDVFVVKTDSRGDTEWTETHGTPAPDFGYDILESRSGEFFITGWSHGFESPEGDVLLVKTGGHN